MSEPTLRIAPSRDDATQPRRSGSTLNFLSSPTPRDEYDRLTAEIAEDVERLKRKVETRANIELHLLIVGSA